MPVPCSHMTASARQSRTRVGARRRIARIGLFPALLGAAGCVGAANEAAIPEVRLLAEKELDCAPRDIRIEEELGGRLLAIGCGRKALYDARCEGVRCVVTEATGPAPGWRDRPEPGP
jgi:hypothetical protein